MTERDRVQCPECGREFDGGRALHGHLNSTHRTRPCTYCATHYPITRLPAHEGACDQNPSNTPTIYGRCPYCNSLILKPNKTYCTIHCARKHRNTGRSLYNQEVANAQ